MKKLILIGTLVMLLTACSQTESLEKIKLTAQAKETEISEKTEIKVETTPEDYELDKENFIVSNNGKITKRNNKYYFSASKKGTYKIQYKAQDGSSNTLTIKVVEKEDTQQDEINNNETSKNNNSEASAAASGQSTPQNAPSSVDKIIEYGNTYISTQQEVWVQGNIPQALLQDANGNMVAVMYNDTNSQYIILDGQVNVNSSRAVATGTLSFNGTNYVLHLTSINPM